VDGAALSGSELSEFLDRPLTPVAPETLDAIERGPIDPGDALDRSELDRLLDPAPLPAETGWCTLGDGVGYVAVRTPMPGLTGEMVDWWFDWHPDEPIRYRIWHPLAHRTNRVDRPAASGAKRHWGTVHHPVEDVGTGVQHVRIEFFPPSELGFGTDALGDPLVATIVCGYPGDDRTRLRHSLMVHVFLAGDDGLVLRSHFWMGAALPRPLASRFVRRRAMPAKLPKALANHCAEEYTHLAAILPELYTRYGPGA
jgi:phloretin hydrolase